MLATYISVGFISGVKLRDIVPKTSIKLESLSAKIVAIDAYNALYQFLSIIRQPNGTPLKDHTGKITSHLSGLLYRTSNLWRDQYPRTVGEALAAGLPVLTEPRDGTKDRVIHGDTGFYCVDFDGFLYALKLLQRKEDYRHKMGLYAKDWAKENLDPNVWLKIVEEILL